MLLPVAAVAAVAAGANSWYYELAADSSWLKRFPDDSGDSVDWFGSTGWAGVAVARDSARLCPTAGDASDEQDGMSDVSRGRWAPWTGRTASGCRGCAHHLHPLRPSPPYTFRGFFRFVFNLFKLSVDVLFLYVHAFIFNFNLRCIWIQYIDDLNTKT